MIALASIMGSIVVVFVIAIAYSRWKTARENALWEAATQPDEEEIRATRHASIALALAALRSEDDAFSFVLFEDFLYALYAEAHMARGANALDKLAPYLSDNARSALTALPANTIEGIVIGGMRIDSISTSANTISLDVSFTTNLAEKDYVGKSHAFYMEEKWRLTRSAAARSRPPERTRVIGCPSCGAPLAKLVMNKCEYCNAVAKPGEQDWFVEELLVLAREPRGPMLTGTTEEVGTDWPTVIDAGVKTELESLRARDAAFTWPAFVARVGVVFNAFHVAWNAQELSGVRPYLSDNLFELQKYWVKAYQEQQLHNRTEHATIVTVHLARVTRDRFFDAITVRVFATCHDYTTDASGKVVGGDKSKTREYTEYWTFIRGSGKSGVPRSDAACPSCGASIGNINMAGVCGSCNAKVTSGEFDWVLSRIEQDEVYERAA